MNGNDMGEELKTVMDDFAKCNEMMESIDLSKLPLELQVKALSSFCDLTAAIKKFNLETKNIIVAASILGRV